MDKFMAAVIQIDSGSSPGENMRQAESLIQEAAGIGARFIALPETVSYIGADCEGHAEQVSGGGRLAAKYRKLHPFDVQLQDGCKVRESDKNCPGNRLEVLDTGEVGVLGLSVCYDLRFCELYRLMAVRGANVFIVPANFTVNTVKDHWEVLLRARAIENGCYVMAPAQIGKKPEYQAYGRSMIVDPWGNVIAKASDAPGIALAQIDLDYVKEVQRQIPVLKNRRPDVCRLECI